MSIFLLNFRKFGIITNKIILLIIYMSDIKNIYKIIVFLTNNFIMLYTNNIKFFGSENYGSADYFKRFNSWSY